MILALMWDMVSWLDRFRLTMGYGAGLLVWGGLFNAVCYVLMREDFLYGAILAALIIKTWVTAASLYLHRRFENRDDVFFYINLGLSRRRMLTTVLAVDYLVWAALVIIIILTQ